jgi:hypothetical protein
VAAPAGGPEGARGAQAASPRSAQAASASLDWWWRPDGWRIASDDLLLALPAGRAGGKARLWLPAQATESPRLVLDLDVADVDARAVVDYLPLERFPPRTVQWLREGILAGRVPQARLEYAGATRRFPFRDGGGLFRVRAGFAGLRLHYQDGWADLEEAGGQIEFRNQGFDATLTAGRVAALPVEHAEARLADYRDAQLIVEAQTRADLRHALAYLQSSPAGPRLGEFFMGLRGAGPIAADVRLDLPFRRFPERVVEVRASLDGARVHRRGRDLTLVTHGASLWRCVAAAEELAAGGIDAEILDLRSLRPLDDATLLESVRRTRRVVIVDEGWRTGGLSGEIAMRIVEQGFYDLDAPVARVCTEEVPIPYPKHLEDAALPNAARIVAAVRRMFSDAQ